MSAKAYLSSAADLFCVHVCLSVCLSVCVCACVAICAWAVFSLCCKSQFSCNKCLSGYGYISLSVCGGASSVFVRVCVYESFLEACAGEWMLGGC